jgi:hypothetical protein
MQILYLSLYIDIRDTDLLAPEPVSLTYRTFSTLKSFKLAI